MTGELSQMIWLTSAANGFLLDRCDPGDFFPANPVFQHCQSVQFVHGRGGWLGGRGVADDPRIWLAHLRERRATRAFLVHSPAPAGGEREGRTLVSGSGSGGWELLVDYPGEREHWIARWESRHEPGVNGKIWAVHYHMTHRGRDAVRIAPADLSADAHALEAALTSVRHFCADKKLDHWTLAFQHALDVLHGEPNFPEHVRPVCLSEYSTQAQRLLAACYHGWAFGPMSSWNDIVFKRTEENETHDSLSRLLHSAIAQAVEDAVNSFGANAAGQRGA